MKHTLELLSALSAFVAGMLWFYSTKATTKEDPPGSASFSAPMTSESGEDFNFAGTIHLQSRISAYAAIAAGISALLQGAATLLPR